MKNNFYYVIDPKDMTLLQEQGFINLELKDSYINNYYLFMNQTNKILVVKESAETFKAVRFKNKITKIQPKDSKQNSLVHCLSETNTLLTVVLGGAGTGKTFISTAYALYEYDLNDKKIVFTKAAMPVGRGRAFGPVPGDVQEKYAPYLDSFKIVLKKLLGESSSAYIDFLIKKKDISYQPVEFVRGNTYENCTFILDECQNLTWHELKTVISRMGEGARLILLGDIDQSDLKPGEQPGLVKLLSSNFFKNSEHTAQIQLVKQYRGPLATLVHEIDKE